MITATAVFYILQKPVKWFLTKLIGGNEKSEGRATVATIGLIILLVLIAFGFAASKCSDWRFNRTQNELNDIGKDKSNANAFSRVANQTAQNANVISVNANLKSREAEANLRRAENANVSNISGAELDKLGRNYR